MNNVRPAVFVAATATAVLLAVSAFFYKRKQKNRPPQQWKPVAKVTKLHLYPLKSGRRIELQSAECTKLGIMQNKAEEKTFQLRDRSFIVYGEKNNEFKTARTFPKMVLISIAVHDEFHVAFDAPSMRTLYVKIPNGKDTKSTKISYYRGEQIYTLDCGDEAAAWFSRYIKGDSTGLRLGYHDGVATAQTLRNVVGVEKEMVAEYDMLSNKSVGMYSDLTAGHLVNQASVDDLNEKMSGNKVTAEQFRPSILIAGNEAPAFSEEDWVWIKIGEVILRNVKPCTRCVMTTIDQETGIRNMDREPLKTLEKYRKLKDTKNIDFEGNLAAMGIHFEVYSTGIINVDDVVYIG